MIWLCIISALSVSPVISHQKTDTNRISVFPVENQSIAGVFQVSGLNYLNQPQYVFNASDARTLCLSLKVNIASKAQVQEALSKGLETCRFGWTDEHLAVIPRIKAVSTCGKNQIGLVTWRAPVTKKFDVFCFNESDAAAQLKDATTDNPLNGRDYSGQTHSSKAASSTRTTHSTSSSTPLFSSTSIPRGMDNEAVPVPIVSRAESSTGGKAILITSTCALLLIAVIIFVYIKMRRSRSSDIKQQQDYIQTEEWVCVTKTKEPQKGSEEEERIEVGDDAQKDAEEEERIEVGDDAS
ncbi:lymphatic vessel endothelial hyaluronic acid receptor 1a [Epinephelus fuscoguttatus]|uniref:lymphatic vessel endothelial hyaluronic acid receptor 1a n=1 Tax=Epinephelus fuscoguttatus TaxID=293821 RepID=UPI0020D0C845|nr:lymphatic vessel endothelial hyaluronic acid receptor 1a [Epinephelus fuscoguttatus]